MYLVSNLFGVYNILKSSVVHTSVTTNQITNFNLLYLLILLLYKKEKKETKKKNYNKIGIYIYIYI